MKNKLSHRSTVFPSRVISQSVFIPSRKNWVHIKLHLPLLGEKPTIMKDDDWTFFDKQVFGVIQLKGVLKKTIIMIIK